MIQSGKPVAVFPTHPFAPLVVMATGILVGRDQTPERFYELEDKGLTIWGGLTAAAWQYIGAQGVIQGTYETFAAVAREHFGGSLAGRLCVSAGLGGMGSAQPLAVTVLGGVLLCAEVDGEKLERRRREGFVERATGDLGEAIGWAREAAAEGRPLSVAVHANAVELLEARSSAVVAPDVVTDLTAAHDLRYGYVPVGTSAAEAAELRRVRSRTRSRSGAASPSSGTSARCSSCAAAARSSSTTATTSARRRRPRGCPRRSRSTSSRSATCARSSAAASARSAGSASPARSRTAT